MALGYRTLSRKSFQRKALLRDLITDLILNGRIETTLAKAKELKRLADKMVTLGKKNTLASRRQAAELIRFETDEEGKYALQKLFDEIAPKLEKLSQSIYTGEFSADGRPERVSERLIYQKLNLSAHRLEKMPKCRSILVHFSESYEENWARRILWAYQKLKTERANAPIFWSDLRDLSGVKKYNIEKVLPFLQKHADTNAYNAIIKIIQ